MSFIIPTVFEKSIEDEFRALFNLVAHLKEDLGPEGPGRLDIPHGCCGGTSYMLTAHCAETPRALYQKPTPIRSYHYVGSLGLKPKLFRRTGVGI